MSLNWSRGGAHDLPLSFSDDAGNPANESGSVCAEHEPEKMVSSCMWEQGSYAHSCYFEHTVLRWFDKGDGEIEKLYSYHQPP